MFFNQFWKNWGSTERLIIGALAAVVLVSFFFFWKSWFDYPAPTIAIKKFQQIETSETITHSFNVGTLSIDVPAQSLVILENALAAPLQVNPFAYYFFLFGLAILFVFFSVIITTLSRFWFLIGSGILILFLASLRLDVLELFGMTGKIPFIAATLLAVAPVYYFHSFKAEATFIFRLIFFSALALVLGLFIFFFSKAQHPFMHLAVNGLITGMIVTLIFILFIAHEIIAFFVWLVSQGGNQSKALRHFLIISVIYILNLFLTYATKMGYVNWNLWTVNLFLLFCISAVFGLWGFWQRRSMYESFFDGASGIYFYLSLAAITFCTLVFFNSTASDMMYDEIQAIILYAHIGYGMIFIFYIIANFGPLLASNLSAYKVLYKPETMPYFTFRLMGLIATFTALVFASNWKRYVNEATATYYHAYADLYLFNGDATTAEGYYKKSLQFRNQNHHAHYALANIASQNLDAAKEREEYKTLIDLTPSVEAYLNLSRDYLLNSDLLQADLLLDDAVKKFPSDGFIQNAKGLSFIKLKQPDSAIYFFKNASRTREGSEMGQTNFMAACSKFNVKVAADSILNSQEFKSDGAMINALALANAQQKKINRAPQKKNDTILTVYQTAWLGNYFINQKENADTTLLNYAGRLAKKEVNADFKEMILASACQAWYAKGEIKKATETMRDLAFTTGEEKYLRLLGVWMLEQNNPAVAARYLIMAFEKNPNVLFQLALANTEADSLQLALVNWDSLVNSKIKLERGFASMMTRVLHSKFPDANSSDEEKYYFCRYKIHLLDSNSFFAAANSINDKYLRVLSFVDRSQKWFDLDEASTALSYLKNAILHLSSEGQVRNEASLRSKILSLQLMLAADLQDWQLVESKLRDSLSISLNQKIYLRALLDEAQGNSTDAKEKYNYLAHANVQFEDALVASSRFFSADTTDRLKAYSILVDGLLVKPNSVKLLKFHVLQAASLRFDSEAQESLSKLEAVLPQHLFRKFVNSYPDFFQEEKR